MNAPPFPVVFTYDHSSGMFTAKLENGASFLVERRHLGGKLSNALELYMRQIIAMHEEKVVKKTAFDVNYEHRDPARNMRNDKLKRYSKVGKVKINLEELEIDI